MLTYNFKCDDTLNTTLFRHFTLVLETYRLVKKFSTHLCCSLLTRLVSMVSFPFSLRISTTVIIPYAQFFQLSRSADLFSYILRISVSPFPLNTSIPPFLSLSHHSKSIL